MTARIPSTEGMSEAEKRELFLELAELAVANGIRLPSSVDSPGQLAERHDQRMVRRAHVTAMDEVFTGLLGTPNGRLMIFSPPQVGKSSMSRWFAFWWLTMHPNHRLVLASYAASLAVTHGSAVRELVRNYGSAYGLNLHPTENTKAAWRVRAGGGMRAIGVQGGLAGQSMDMGILDDPVKDRAEAESPVVRNALWDWYSAVWSTRRQPGTRECLVMTRYHADDLAGRLLDQDGRVEEGGEWTVLHMPALALAPDPEKGIYPDALGRAPGEPLSHPKISDGDHGALLAHWARQRRRATNRDWNALYQGNPFDAEGALLTDDDIREASKGSPGEPRRVAVGVDPSGGGRDDAGIIGGLLDQDGKVWFTHDRTARLPADAWAAEACRLAHEIGATRFVIEKNYGGDMATTILTQAWRQLQIDGHIPEADLCPLVQPVTARASKVLRAEPIAQAIKTGRIGFHGELRKLKAEWTQWEPGSTWSPGALDAAVHLAHELVPPIPRGAKTESVAARKIGEQAPTEGGIAAMKLAR
jgi:hypothetical protein